MPTAAIVDVDGTLVDTNYHHALCWYRAFREHGLVIPLWRLHRHVGMGGDQYVGAVAGEEVEERLGDGLRDRWEELFNEVIDEIEPLPEAANFLASVKER
ncbi:MAG: HAD family phosphatase, partial [Thermoleophilia bacterium]|nr:HAD family phosphatase [Thermoleophilia bacterium]